MSYESVITQGDKSTFGNMINATKLCLTKKGVRPGSITMKNFQQALDCETAYFSQDDGYTYHTHPNGDPNPSEMDRNTTNRFGKKFMFIGLVPTREVVVYQAPKFDKIIGRFRV